MFKCASHDQPCLSSLLSHSSSKHYLCSPCW